MAVKIKSLNGLAAIKKIGLSDTLFDWLSASPVKVALTAKEFVFTLPPSVTPKADPELTLPVTLTDMQKLSMGTLEPSKQALLKAALADLVGKIKSTWGSALEGVSEGELDEAWHFNAAPPKASTLSKLPPLTPTLTVPPETAKEIDAILTPAKSGVTVNSSKSGLWLPFPEDKMKSAPLTKLRDANQMYQPVLGTSAGSRYYVVGGNNDLRIAARLVGSKLSVRVEGPGFGPQQTHLAQFGMSVSEGKTGAYASIHLNVGDDLTMASKTLGAILLGLGLPLDTPMPEIKKINNK